MLHGENVILRTIRESDFETIFRYLNDVRLRGEFENIGLFSEAQMQKGFGQSGFWEQDEGMLVITDREGTLLGHIGFSKPYSSPTRLGYEISYAIDDPAHWGRGLMTEAVSLFVPFLFATNPIERIQAVVHPENIGSQRVLEKVGFALEGVLRRVYLFRGRPSDVHLYSILRDESPPLALGDPPTAGGHRGTS